MDIRSNKELWETLWELYYERHCIALQKGLFSDDQKAYNVFQMNIEKVLNMEPKELME